MNAYTFKVNGGSPGFDGKVVVVGYDEKEAWRWALDKVRKANAGRDATSSGYTIGELTSVLSIGPGTILHFDG
jgi:hypothetical protein